MREDKRCWDYENCVCPGCFKRLEDCTPEWCDDLEPFYVSNNAAQFATGNVLQLAVE